MFVLIKGKTGIEKIGITFQLIADNKKERIKVQLACVRVIFDNVLGSGVIQK